MPFKRGTWRRGRVLLLLVMLVVVGLVSVGCVSGLQPIGWSGGAVSDDTLFLGSKEGRLVAVNLAAESVQWSEALKAAPSGGFGCALMSTGGGCGTAPSGVAIYGTPAISADLVYIGGYNGKIYAFAANSLSTRWVFPREGYLGPIVGELVVAQGKVYFGDSDGKVYALDAATGDYKWDFPTGDKIWSTPAISDGTLFIGSFDKKLYAIDTATGKEKWEPFETQGAIIATPLVFNGVVYIGSFDRHFYAIDANTGKEIWKFPKDEDTSKPDNWFWAEPVVLGNTIYAGCLDNNVYALKADTGDKVTEFKLDSPVSSSPVVVDSSIIFASRKGVVYTIDTSRNELKPLADIQAEIYGPLCVSNGVVYIHTQDLTLHRVDATTGAVLRSISLKSKG